MNKITLYTDLTPEQAISLLRDEIDKEPSLFRCFISLNSHYYIGTSKVCGKIWNNSFILKNRKGPSYSLRASGNIINHDDKSLIEIIFTKPILPDILRIFNGYKEDKEIIINFLKEVLNVKELN